MSSLALDIFRRLIEQVGELESSAQHFENDASSSDPAPVMRRAAYVLAVAAIDTYFHEQAVRLLASAATASQTGAKLVAKYLTHLTISDVTGSRAESLIRMQLTYKTLVSPSAVDGLLTACGRDPDSTWRDVAVALISRPDRVRPQLQLIYDRRNQVAHEGDWDFVQIDFRRMEKTHLDDCVQFATSLAEALDGIL